MVKGVQLDGKLSPDLFHVYYNNGPLCRQVMFLALHEMFAKDIFQASRYINTNSTHKGCPMINGFFNKFEVLENKTHTHALVNARALYM